MNQKIYELAKKLNNTMTSECSEFIVTGSLALNLFGLVKDDNVKDLDVILIHPTISLIKSLRLLEKTSPAIGRSEYHINLQKDDLIRVSMNGINVDFFIDTKERECVNHFGILFSTINEIVKAKKLMGRLKDYIQLMGIANEIISTPELVEFLNKKNV